MSAKDNVRKQKRQRYSALAREFGYIRIGKYGVDFLPKDPNGKIYKLINIVPLDCWITDPKEIEHHFRENGFEL